MVGRVVMIAVSLALLARPPVGAQAGELSSTPPTARPASMMSIGHAGDGPAASRSAWFEEAIGRILSDPATEGRSSADGPATPAHEAH